MLHDELVTSLDHADKPRGLFDGFEGYRTPTSEDYKNVLNSGLVVPDTNVLLNLYRYNAQTQGDLFAVLERLGENLWVPHQVLLEFWRNRESALRDLQETGESTVDTLTDLCQQSISTLRTWSNRVALPQGWLSPLQDALEQGFTEVHEAITGLVNADATEQNRNTYDDRVLLKLDSVLRGLAGAPLEADAYAAAAKEGKRRVAEGIPPGYKDKAKGDKQSVGDYLVWEQLLQEAERRQRDVLLVTGDVKEDWWRKDRGQTRGPRLELVEELQARAGVRLFMMRPESLLLHAKEALDVTVSDESLQDVERVDRSLSREETGGWTQDAIQELLDRLSNERPVQAAAIRLAADNEGFVNRESIYELGEYDQSRMLRGFTRPPNRLAQEFRDRGIVSDGAVDILEAVYDPKYSYVQASGFRIPHQLISLVRAATAAD